LKVSEIHCKSILVKSRIDGIDYAINPYIGCVHGCVYCYAKFMKRFTGHREPWGRFLDIKINAPEILKREMKKYKRGTIMMGTVTDPYQPIEEKYRLTRGLLRELMHHSFHIHIQTKSALILRDLDIFKEMPHLEIGMTITTYDEKIRRIFEPGASSIKSRVSALKEISEKGIDTFVFLGPILPYITRKTLLPLLNMILSSGIKYLYIDKMNYIKSNLGNLSKALKQIDPKLTSLYLKLNNKYYNDLILEIEHFCKDNGLEYQFCF